MTKTQFPWVTWRWADPLWWAERQIEAAAYVIRLTETVVDACLSSLGSVTGRSISAPAAGAYAPGAETVTARVTAPAAVTAPFAPSATANGTRPATAKDLEMNNTLNWVSWRG